MLERLGLGGQPHQPGSCVEGFGCVWLGGEEVKRWEFGGIGVSVAGERKAAERWFWKKALLVFGRQKSGKLEFVGRL